MKRSATLRGTLILGGLLVVTAPLAAQADGCALLRPGAVGSLLGGKAVGTAAAAGCSWKTGAGDKKLVAIMLKARGPAAEMAFMGARQSAAKGGTATVTDESGMGDKAFSTLTAFGVAMIFLKQGRLLQLQYHTGGTGTPKDLEALRPVAKQAIAAY